MLSERRSEAIHFEYLETQAFVSHPYKIETTAEGDRTLFQGFIWERVDNVRRGRQSKTE